MPAAATWTPPEWSDHTKRQKSYASGVAAVRVAFTSGLPLVTASQHRKRLARDAQGWRGAGASRFRFGGKKEAAGVCRGCGESMEIQSKLACNQIFSTKRRLPMKRTLQAHTLRVWHNRASAAPAASFLPTNHPELVWEDR